MRNMKFVKRIGVAVLAACMVLSCVGCGSSSNKGAAEGTTEAVSYTHLDVYKRQVSLICIKYYLRMG